MDKKLFDLVAASTPKFNDLVVNGLAVQHMRYVEQYVEKIIRTAEVDFPPELRYVGYRRCTPQEEYAEVTRRLGTQSTFELARSDLYLVKYIFTYNGEELEPVFLYLPFVTDAGLITIRGSTFSISPVLADKAISVGPDNIFIPLNRDKLTFERQIQHFFRNGERETVYVVWSQIYHLKGNKRPTGKSVVRGKTTLAHYLFAKYGVTRTFAEFANATVVVGTPDTINAETYPPDKWVICSSTQLKPRGVRDKQYVASNLQLAIKKQDYNLTTASLIGGFFYVVDHFPNRVQAEYIDETRLWRVLMGHLLFGSGGNEGKLHVDVTAHLRSLDGYLDSEAKAYLREDGVICEDLYGLLMHIIETFSHRVTSATAQVASMYDKRLMVLRYVLYDLTNAINKFMFKVISTKKKPMTKADVVKLMKHTLKANRVMGINRNHGEVNSVSSPGDNKFFKITSQIVLQTDSSGGRGKKITSADPGKYLHASIAEVGSYNTMGKSEPTGRNKINPCVKIDPDGLIVRDSDKLELIDRVQRKIQR